MKSIKKPGWSRQWHLANAGIKAGWGWAKGQLTTLAIDDDELRDAARLQLARDSAKNWVVELGKLKGGVVKAGQILATYGDYCLPLPLAEALHALEDETESLSWSAIRPHVEKSLGKKTHGLIIERVAIAAASLSQVHKARIKESGEIICLKIIYPDIAETLTSDLSMLEKYVALWMGKEEMKIFSQRMTEISAVLSDEIDMQVEVGKLQRWQKILANDRRYAMPSPEEYFCADTILAMSYEPGVSQNDQSVMQLSQQRRNTLAANMLELLLREILLWGEMQTDPHAGNYRIRIDETGAGNDVIVLLDFGSVRRMEEKLLLPLRKMLIAAYRDNASVLQEGLAEAGFLARDTPSDVRQAFSDVLMGLMEPVNYRFRLSKKPGSVPQCAVDDAGNYCWAAARLPKRMGKQAIKSAFSQHFSFPGIDFMLVARKLAGVYSFIAALDARFDAGIVMEKVMAEMPDNPVQNKLLSQSSS